MNNATPDDPTGRELSGVVTRLIHSMLAAELVENGRCEMGRIR